MIHKRDVFIVLFHLYVNPIIHSMYYVLFLTIIAGHSFPECGFEGLKTYQAPAHSWDLSR